MYLYLHTSTCTIYYTFNNELLFKAAEKYFFYKKHESNLMIIYEKLYMHCPSSKY